MDKRPLAQAKTALTQAQRDYHRQQNQTGIFDFKNLAQGSEEMIDELSSQLCEVDAQKFELRKEIARLRHEK